jgi:hypothetical protein
MRRSVVVVSAALLAAGLLAGCGSHPAGRSKAVGVRSPALRVLSPRNHARLTLPAAVHYQAIVGGMVQCRRCACLLLDTKPAHDQHDDHHAALRTMYERLGGRS